MQPFQSEEIPILVTPNKDVENGDSEEAPGLEYFTQKQLNSFNVLLLGIDNWDNELSRTDLMMLINVDTTNKQISIISIPRDTRVEIPDVGYTKINHAHLIGETKGGNKGGTELALQTTSDFFQTMIHYYVKVDIEGFINFIDSIGGIEIELTRPVKLSHIDVTLPMGKQNIDGNLAFNLVRERYSMADGDFGRQKNHYLVLNALAYKLLSPGYLTKLPELIKSARKEIVDTNFKDIELISLAWLLKGLTKENINYVQIPGRSEYHADPLIKATLYYWVPNMDKVNEIAAQYLNN
jgi:LCP family protein required for cell wall assembly